MARRKRGNTTNQRTTETSSKVIVVLKDVFKNQNVTYSVPKLHSEDEKNPLFGKERVYLESASQEELAYLLEEVGMKKFLTKVPDNKKNENSEDK